MKSVPQLQTIHDILRELMRAIESRDAQRIAEALNCLTAAQARIGADAPPMLRHYLERRSYQKALEYLETGQAQARTPRCEG